MEIFLQQICELAQAGLFYGVAGGRGGSVSSRLPEENVYRKTQLY